MKSLIEAWPHGLLVHARPSYREQCGLEDEYLRCTATCISHIMALSNPPFDSTDGLVAQQQPPAHVAGHRIPLALPAIFEVRDRRLRFGKSVNQQMDEFLKQELDVTRLNRLHKHLWVAGLPHLPRTLHNQVEIGRQILVTEKADMHMLWSHPVIYLKPLPDFLLCYDVWENHMRNDSSLHAAALGLLQSYIWLIAYPSDHKLAIEFGLINKNVTWADWSLFVSALVGKGILNAPINPRYHFGELRLPRIQWAYRLCRCGARRDRGFVRGYYYRYHTYTSFIERNLAWLLTVFLYVAVVLDSMQVGLGTKHLSKSDAFQKASWGFTVTAIVGPLAIVGAVLLWTIYLVFTNYVFTTKKKGKPGAGDPVWNNIALANYQH